MTGNTGIRMRIFVYEQLIGSGMPPTVAGNRRSEEWRARTREESQQVLESVGLAGEFWELPR